MCYSAMVEQHLKSLERHFHAEVDHLAVEELFRRRLADPSLLIGKALEANYGHPQLPTEHRIKEAIDGHRNQLASKYEAGLFEQRTRLINAERTLASKSTKKALEDKRIATNKIEWNRVKLADLRRTEVKPNDSRIFPFWYAPVVIMENGKRVIKPMRYHCRPAGIPASYDTRYDGLYNARRDNLEGFWKNQFGSHHAIAVVSSFFENVARHSFEKRELATGEKPRNIVLHFDPNSGSDMLLACVWDRWQALDQPDLYSFAAITDEPPPEIAATGHERCVIPLTPDNVDAWLTPQGRTKEALYALLDQRERPYYDHRIAA